jgi:CRP-like cAMP-binding protein
MAEISLFHNARDTVHVPAGEAIFSEGDPGDAMFAVVEGEVELTRHGVPLDLVTRGGVIGEMALVDASPRSATAVARTDARVVRVDETLFKYLVHEHPTFALQVMAVMADRLRAANGRVAT